MRLSAGARLGSFTIVGPLGAGGMGEVYLARDSRLERDVALKLLPSRVTDDAETRARFRQEALTLASLNHPNVATVHGFEEDAQGSLVLVLELVEGVSLAARLSSGALAIDEALEVALQVSQALEAAHELGIIHRDVKPGNIMIGPRGLVKVLDFGLARRVGGTVAASGSTGVAELPDLGALAEGETLAAPALARAGGADTTSDVLVGTPGYMSPEQALAAPVDERTDVFAFGCVLYECLAGRKAFEAATPELAIRATLLSEPDLAALPAAAPARIRELVARCLAKSAGARPASARELRESLEEALEAGQGAPRPAAAATPHNLPAPATSFVGRESVVEACARALDGTRALTLTGIGGSGKTRLALRVAEARLAQFADGVWFVDAAPLANSERLVEVLADAIGAKEEPGLTLGQAVVRALESKTALVVIDNAETHLAASAALASALLAACRGVRLLVTSREPLAIAGEAVFPVPVLGVPGPKVARAADAATFESVRLFAERARATAPAFELTDENAAAVAEICRRLDGIPLALELAAARVRLLGVDQVRARLGDRFKLLTRAGGSDGRQNTVLAVLQWSWDHLLPPEQELLTHLAAFAGGWTLEQATAVHAQGADEFEVLDLLTRLVERSLVVVDHGAKGSVRYRFLESVWRFAQEKLAASPDRDAVRGRHLDVYIALSDQADKAMNGSGIAQALATLVVEEENLLAALDCCAHLPDGAVRGLRLASACSRSWSLRGHVEFGRRVINKALADDAEALPSLERGRLLSRAAGFDMHQGDPEAGKRHLEEALAISRALRDRLGEARAVSGLGVVAMWQGRRDDMLALAEQGLEIYTELGQERGVGMAMHNIASVEIVRGNVERALGLLEQALAIFQKVGDHMTEALCLSALVSARVRTGDLAGARTRMRECFARLRGLEAPRESLFALEAFAELLAATGQPREAARALATTERMRAEIGMPLMPSERADLEQVKAKLAEAPGADYTAAARAADGERNMATALAEAQAFLDAV